MQQEPCHRAFHIGPTPPYPCSSIGPSSGNSSPRTLQVSDSRKSFQQLTLFLSSKGRLVADLRAVTSHSRNSKAAQGFRNVVPTS